VTLRIRDFSRCPLTREDAQSIARVCPAPTQVDFSGVVSVSHCFADELFSRLSPARPEIINASTFVAKVVNAVYSSPVN